MSGNSKSDVWAAVAALDARVTLLEERLSALAEGILTHRDACLGHFVPKADHTRDLELTRDLVVQLIDMLKKAAPGSFHD